MTDIKQVLLEHGLARLQHHLSNGHPVGIIAAATGEDASHTRFRHLIRSARELGYGPIVATGKTKEWGSERSLVVPNISLGHLKKLGNDYGQQAVIHHSKGMAKLHWLKASGEKNGSSEDLGHAHFNKKNDLGITVLKGAGWRPKDDRTPGRSFTFGEDNLISLEIPPTGLLNRLWKPYV